MTDQRTPCPHCPDGHDDPNRKPWAVYVGAECDGDGQPINLRVGPSNCSHVAESDAEWLRGVIRAAKPQRSDSHDNGAAASARRIADELTGRIDAIMRESADAHEAGDARLGTTLGFLAAVLDDLRAVLAENEAMRQQLAALKTEWEVRVERPGRPRTQGTFNAARIAHGAADAIRQAEPDADISVHSRLVGEWQPAEGGEQPERLTSDAWCKRYGLDVRDDDGWRTDGTAWDTPLALPDFWRRYGRSTARMPTTETYDRIMADVQAAKAEGGE